MNNGMVYAIAARIVSHSAVSIPNFDTHIFCVEAFSRVGFTRSRDPIAPLHLNTAEHSRMEKKNIVQTQPFSQVFH